MAGRRRTESNKQSIKVDPSMISEDDTNAYTVGLSKDAIPDTEKMMRNIDKLLDFIESPHMKELEETDKDKFENLAFMKFNNILPMKIISLLVEDERYKNLETLLDMLETLSHVKKGKKDLLEETKKFSEKRNEEYMYPKFGGKENFEKTMREKQ